MKRHQIPIIYTSTIVASSVLAAFMMLCVGCDRVYQHRLVNNDEMPMRMATVECNGQSFTHGNLNPGYGKGYTGPFKLPGGAEATLSWEAEGTNISHTVVLPADAHKYRIVFQLKETGVEVELHDPF